MMNDRTSDRSRWGEPESAPGAPGPAEQEFDEAREREPYLGSEEDRLDGDRMARADRLVDTEPIDDTPRPEDGSTTGGAVVGGGAGAIAGGAIAGPPGAVVGAVIGAIAGAAAGGAAGHDDRVFPEDGGG